MVESDNTKYITLYSSESNNTQSHTYKYCNTHHHFSYKLSLNALYLKHLTTKCDQVKNIYIKNQIV